jgi:hypothetical protein
MYHERVYLGDGDGRHQVRPKASIWTLFFGKNWQHPPVIYSIAVVAKGRALRAY